LHPWFVFSPACLRRQEENQALKAGSGNEDVISENKQLKRALQELNAKVRKQKRRRKETKTVSHSWLLVCCTKARDPSAKDQQLQEVGKVCV
jgi:hypothetical protein